MYLTADFSRRITQGMYVDVRVAGFQFGDKISDRPSGQRTNQIRSCNNPLRQSSVYNSALRYKTKQKGYHCSILSSRCNMNMRLRYKFNIGHNKLVLQSTVASYVEYGLTLPERINRGYLVASLTMCPEVASSRECHSAIY